MYNVLISFKVAHPVRSISLILTGVLVFIVTECTLYFVFISDQFNPWKGCVSLTNHMCWPLPSLVLMLSFDLIRMFQIAKLTCKVTQLADSYGYPITIHLVFRAVWE